MPQQRSFSPFLSLFALICASLITSRAQSSNKIRPPEDWQILKPLEMKSPEEVSKPEEKLFVIGGIAELPIYSFYIGKPDIDGKAYLPNFATRLGPRIMYKKMGLRMTFALPIPEKEIERRGESEQRNLILSFYWKGHAIDFYHQYFKGFYVSSPLTELEFNKPNRFTQLPEAESTHWGFNWYYNVNPQQFSLNSAFDQTEFNLEPGGTWVLIPFFRHWKIDLGDEIKPGTDPDDLQTIPDLATGRFDTLGTSLAYAKTWLKGRWYISGLAGLGPGLQSQHFVDEGKNVDKFSVAGKLNMNLSAGTKTKDYTLGTNFLVDSIYAQVSGTQVYSSFMSLEFFINRRF